MLSLAAMCFSISISHKMWFESRSYCSAMSEKLIFFFIICDLVSRHQGPRGRTYVRIDVTHIKTARHANEWRSEKKRAYFLQYSDARCRLAITKIEQTQVIHSFSLSVRFAVFYNRLHFTLFRTETIRENSRADCRRVRILVDEWTANGHLSVWFLLALI